MVSQLYDGISCPLENCVYALGTPIVLSDAAVSGIDFDLVAFNPQWKISGSVLDSVGQSPGGVVPLFYPNGAFAAELPLDGAGNFQSHPLLDGTYFMVTFGTSEMLDEAWDDVPCENLSCDITGSLESQAQRYPDSGRTG